MSEHTNYVAIDLLDKTTGCALRREKIPYDIVHNLFEYIHLDDLKNHQFFTLDRGELDLLSKSINLHIDDEFDGADVMIWHSNLRPLESSHTRRELWLMLRGEKPLAAFIEDYKQDGMDSLIPENYFLPYVQEGRFVCREVISDFLENGTKVRQVFYAVPGEVWRIDAYLALWDLSSKIGWRDGFEQFEGYLLGYKPEESTHRDATPS